MTDCLFCRMINKEIKAKIEHEDDEMFAIHDINPQAPVHLLIMPKKHIDRISNMKTSDAGLIGRVIDTAKEIAKKNGWDYYRLVFNDGSESGQSVFHIHLHLLAGRLMKWPPG